MSIRLNYTSFTSPTMAAALLNAMAACWATGDAQRVLNRHKEAFLLVVIEKDSLGYAYKFYSAYDGLEIGKVIQRASQHWSPLSFQQYWEFLGNAWDLTEGRLVTLAREQEEITTINRLMDEGVTHTAVTWGGTRLHVAYQRDWLCRKRLYVYIGSGEWVKMSPEMRAMVHHLERL